MDQQELKVLQDVEQYGCHIVHVMEDIQYPRFSYSVGIEDRTGNPEILITGLKPQLAKWIINEYNKRVINGENIITDQKYSGFLEGFNILFKQIQKKFYNEYLGWDLWYYKGDNFKAMQVIYPNTSGIWPWEEEASDDFKWFIPKLY